MPMMNKTGHSMYWNSMWDDKLNYSRSFKEDMFIRMFFSLFIEGGYLFIFRYKINSVDSHLNFLKNKYNLHFVKIKKDEKHYFYVLDPRKNSQRYLSRVWLLKYQTWIIFYFFTYSFDLSFFKKKKKLKKKIYKQYFNILNSYYFNTFKLGYNYKSFNKYIFNNIQCSF